MKYKLLILGVPLINAESKIPNLPVLTNSLAVITYNIIKAFKKLNHIKLSFLNRIDTNIPKADFALLSCYCNDKINYNLIREKSSALKICSLREIPFTKCDYSFIWNSEALVKNSHLFSAPCNKSLMENVSKESKSILIDHYWKDYLKTENDWTNRIENWLETIKKEYKIYRMIRYKKEDKNIKSFEIPIYLSDYLTYLKNTSKIETYIVTHKESYGYSVIDMLTRGIRVLSPPNFLPKKSLVNYFNIPIFKNQTEFLMKIKEPINKSFWDNQINKCTDYNDIAKIIDSKFQKWIKNEN